jgi:hypothetical protein
MRLLPIALAVTAFGAQAGELPPEVTAKFMKILANAASTGGSVAASSPEHAAAFRAQGLSVSPFSKLAWASSLAELRNLKNGGKLVVCGRVEWLAQGAGIALVAEGDKPAIYLHMGHISASGVSLSDTVLKIGKKL